MVRRKANISGGNKLPEPETPVTLSTKEEKTVRTYLGRTPVSWAKILTFYVIFYTCLLGFSCFNYYIFSLIVLDDNEPNIKLSNPGVGFRPLPNEDSAQSLIWFTSQDDQQAKAWYGQLSQYVKEANTGDPPCSYNNTVSDKMACQVDLSNLGECNEENKFGYTKAKPCILIKLNRIFDWEPLPYGINKTGQYDKDSLSSELKSIDMPIGLRKYIFKKIEENPSVDAKTILSSVWISCDGKNAVDKHNLLNKISYTPSQMIPGFYFPYKKQHNYRSPFVFVQFDLSSLTIKHHLVDIECRAWAKNFEYDASENIGSVRFQILVD